MNHAGFGWTILVLGLVIAGIELVLILAPSVPWLGRLPGDIRIERDMTPSECSAATLRALTPKLG